MITGRFNTSRQIALFLIILTLIVYAKAGGFELLYYDDNLYITDNQTVQGGLSWSNAAWAFTTMHAANWHPLTWLSLMLDIQLFGPRPGALHLINVLLHAVNTVLLFLILARMTGAQWRSAFVAAVFAIHPLHVESVAWVAERKDLLCALFFLLSVAAFTNYIASVPNEADKKNTLSAFLNRRYLAALGFFVLALLSKPMAVSLPVVLLILDWYPFQRIYSFRMLRYAFVEKLPFIVLSLLSSILTVLAQKSGNAIWVALPLSTRVLVAIKSLLAYIGKIAFPVNLVPFYPYPQTASFLSLEYLTATALVLCTTIICIVLSKKTKLWLTIWCYYVVTLLPVIGIVQVGGQSMADRYTYLPGLALFLIIGLAVAWAAGKVRALNRRSPLAKVLSATVAILAFISLCYLTSRQIGIWKDSFVLWNYVIEKEPERAPVAYNSRGIAFETKGQFDKAIKDYDKAIALSPSYYEAFFNRGTAFETKGQLDKAIVDYDKAIALNPSYYEAYANRGMIYEKMGQPDKAIEEYHKTITLDPSSHEAYYNLGVLYGKAGLLDKAMESFNASLAINPNRTDSYINRGIVNSLIGRQEMALRDFNSALLLDQGNAAAYFNRGNLYFRTAKRELALSDYQRACRLGNNDGCNAFYQLTAGLDPE